MSNQKSKNSRLLFRCASQAQNLVRLRRLPEAVAVPLGERLERHQVAAERRGQRPFDPTLNHRSTLAAACST
jgi:hypothetical protein